MRIRFHPAFIVPPIPTRIAGHLETRSLTVAIPRDVFLVSCLANHLALLDHHDPPMPLSFNLQWQHNHYETDSHEQPCEPKRHRHSENC